VVDKRSIQHARRIHKPAGVLIVPLITAVVLMGIYESVRFTKALVVVKIVVVIVVVAVGVFYVNPANWQPFLPNGPLSIVTAASVIFLAYIGFDVVSTTAEETRNPQKDLPAGLIGSLVVCTVLYVSIGAILTGMVPVSLIDIDSPVASAFERLGLSLVSSIISVGVIAGLTSVIAALLIGQPRILMARPGTGCCPHGPQRSIRAMALQWSRL
jgi:APA family basic amino acid/polyamine antiporter